MTEKPRIQFIDLAKGVCILLVVLFHAQILTVDTPLLGALRMPLYFFLSGLFFKTYGGLPQLALRKVNRIIIPFFFFYLLGELAFIAIIHGFGENIATTYHHNILTPLLNGEPHNYPIWFLVCLFWSNLIFCFIRIMSRHEAFTAAVVLLCAIAGIAMSTYDIQLPAWFVPAFTALPFFYMGYMVRRTPLLTAVRPRLYDAAAGIGLLGVGFVLALLLGNPHLSLAHNKVVGNPGAAYLLSVLSIVGLMLTCKALHRLPIVSYMGRYSIIVLGLHMLFMSPVRVAMRPYDPVFCNWVSGLTAILMCLAAIPICRRYVPRFTAQEDLIPEMPLKLPILGNLKKTS